MELAIDSPAADGFEEDRTYWIKMVSAGWDRGEVEAGVGEHDGSSSVGDEGKGGTIVVSESMMVVLPNPASMRILRAPYQGALPPHGSIYLATLVMHTG